MLLKNITHPLYATEWHVRDFFFVSMTCIDFVTCGRTWRFVSQAADTVLPLDSIDN